MQTTKGILTETVIGLLKSGKSVELPATGYSMFPAFRPGDIVLVSPLQSTPGTGTVMVILKKAGENPGIFVMHRLVEIRKDSSGGSIFITRGDSRNEPDEAWSEQQILGVAVSLKRGTRTIEVRPFVPTALRYRLNLSMLWLYGKMGWV